jgi:hypothetical protein
MSESKSNMKSVRSKKSNLKTPTKGAQRSDNYRIDEEDEENGDMSGNKSQFNSTHKLKDEK